jgi:hypothetical protein
VIGRRDGGRPACLPQEVNVKVRCSCLLLAALLFGTAGAGPFDSLWVSYSNNNPGVFAVYGPQRVMRINPGDFGLTYPFEIDSLMVEFYDGMGSWTDSVYTWRIYAGDGSTLLYESDSLIAPRSLWARYGLTSTVQIDSGSFYIGMTHRLYQSPFAYPFIMTDNSSGQTHCLYGSPDAWQAWDVGEYFFYATSALVRSESKRTRLRQRRQAPGGQLSVAASGSPGPARLSFSTQLAERRLYCGPGRTTCGY